MSADALLDRIMEGAAQRARDHVEQWWEDYAERVESPVELGFLCAFIALLVQNGERFLLLSSSLEEQKHQTNRVRPDDIITVIQPQGRIGRFRADFMIIHQLGTHLSEPFIVEIDGHDFHEKTKEQAARDKSRDRYFQSRHIKVFRFTGSELYRDPFACAEEIWGFIDGLKLRVPSWR